MKKVELFHLRGCPHCHRALRYWGELQNERPEYGGVELTLIEETEEKGYADAHDYYYVPTFYVDGVKIFEGSPRKDDIEAVLRAAVQ